MWIRGISINSSGEMRMKVAVIGSKRLTVTNLEIYLPPHTDEIVSGGGCGIDACARSYAKENGIPLTEFLPDDDMECVRSLKVRNAEIVLYSDFVLAFWDGTSEGTADIIDTCRKHLVPIQIYREIPKIPTCFFLQSEV